MKQRSTQGRRRGAKARACLTTAALALALPCTAVRAQGPAVAITVDDLPTHVPLPAGTTRLAIAGAIAKALAAVHAPPTYGFVNGAGVEQEPANAAVLDLWRKRGNLLGNHTWSHMDLAAHSAEEFEAEIAKNEPAFSPRMAGADWHWFRYPFLHEEAGTAKGPAVRRYLAGRGYKVAAVTMSFSDFLWNEPYARCAAKNDQQSIAFLEQSYLQAARAEAQYQTSESRSRYGREIPFVLLMHIGAFDARMFPRLLAQYRELGFRFVSLPAAEKDPAYANDVHPAGTAKPAEASAGAPAHPQPPAQALLALCR